MHKPLWMEEKTYTTCWWCLKCSLIFLSSLYLINRSLMASGQLLPSHCFPPTPCFLCSRKTNLLSLSVVPCGVGFHTHTCTPPIPECSLSCLPSFGKSKEEGTVKDYLLGNSTSGRRHSYHEHSPSNDYLNVCLGWAACPSFPCPTWCLAQGKGSVSMEEMKNAMTLEE